MPLNLYPTQDIIDQAPFSDQLTIDHIEPLKYGGSGCAFKILDTRKRAFKLRVCNTEQEAADLERKIQKLTNIFPHLIGRDRCYLLIEFIDGQKINYPKMMHRSNAKQHFAQFWFQAGKLLGQANCHPDIGDQSEIDQFFFCTLETLTRDKHLKKPEHQRIKNQYQTLRQQYEYRFCLDLQDTYLPNFLTTSSRLYYIDEGGLSHIQGMGLTTCFRQLDNYFKRHTLYYAQHLLAGYTQTHSTPNPTYLLMVGFYEQMRRVASRIKKGESLYRDITRLQTFQIN